MPDVTLTVPIVIDEARIADLLCCAFEGGITYWCDEIEWASDADSAQIASAYLSDAVAAGRAVRLHPNEDPGVPNRILNIPGMKLALITMAAKYPKHFANFMAGDEDAETGDVFVQLAVFGDIIFG